MVEIYEVIDRLLIERKISGVKMSSDLGMSKSFMTELRKGRTKGMTVETAQKIADYFDVPISFLLNGGQEECFVSGSDTKLLLSEDEASLVLAYRRASPDDSTIVDTALRKYQADEPSVYYFASAAKGKGLRETTITEEQLQAAREAARELEE